MEALSSAVAAVITDADGRVLLCQQSQGRRLWCLPGGRMRAAESPVAAVIRGVLTQTGTAAEIVDLVGLYHLTGDGCGDGLPDVLVHVFRARIEGTGVTVNAPGRICRLAWCDPACPPQPMTATARIALADAAAGRRGVLRDVQRDAGPKTFATGEVDAAIPPQPPVLDPVALTH
ncbi:MAG: NUDIX hydrolase [Micromonosporaceae bacterium]